MTPADVADYTAGVLRARAAYAADPSHVWCRRGCFNLATRTGYCCNLCANAPRRTDEGTTDE